MRHTGVVATTCNHFTVCLGLLALDVFLLPVILGLGFLSLTFTSSSCYLDCSLARSSAPAHDLGLFSHPLNPLIPTYSQSALTYPRLVGLYSPLVLPITQLTS